MQELISALDALAISVSRDRGEVLFRSGEPVSGVFIVREGRVRMSIEPASLAFPPKLLEKGGIAGLPAVLTGEYSLTAEVAERAEMGWLPAQRVLDLLECDKRLCLMAMRMLSQEISSLRARIKGWAGSRDVQP